jgi:hypothetical protein
LALFLRVTAGLFVWPEQGVASRASAIVMLDSPGHHPLSVALRLAREHRAPFLVVSQGRPVAHDPCPPAPLGVTLICFNPNPATTQGEAEFVGRLAKQYHWRSIVVVAITPQVSRARLRVERCFPGKVDVEGASIKLTRWPYHIAYEWGALLKALVVQRAC